MALLKDLGALEYKELTLDERVQRVAQMVKSAEGSHFEAICNLPFQPDGQVRMAQSKKCKQLDNAVRELWRIRDELAAEVLIVEQAKPTAGSNGK